MYQSYPVFWQNDLVGQANIAEDGLYNFIQANMKLAENTLYKLFLCFDAEEVDLGICIPCDNGFVVKKRIPKKKCPDKPLRFVIRHFQKEGKCQEKSSEIDITKLQSYQLQTTPDGMRLVITGQFVNQQGNDPIP